MSFSRLLAKVLVDGLIQAGKQPKRSARQAEPTCQLEASTIGVVIVLVIITCLLIASCGLL